MNLRLFFYQITNKTPEGEISTEASFNVELVSQTMTLPKGDMQVCIQDWHNRLEVVEIPLKNGGKREEARDMQICTVITLNSEDAKRFKSLYSVDNYTYKHTIPSTETAEV